MIYTNENFLIKEEKLIIPFSLKYGVGINMKKMIIFALLFIYCLGKGMIVHSLPTIYEFLIIGFIIIINIPFRRGNTIWINFLIRRYQKKNIKDFKYQSSIFEIENNISREIFKVNLLNHENIQIKSKKAIEKW